jgi:prepilin-type N-terminal cleavage/methylation domain-containing protein
MISRRGFTLLEVIVSITVAGIIALLAYGSASAGFDTRDALARHRATTESELRARALIADALRHASDEADPGQPAFELTDAMDANGLPSDELTFLTRGVMPPLGASELWIVSLAPSPKGLVIRAKSSSAANAAGVVATVAGVRGLEVEAMSIADRSWTGAWASSAQIPAAARLTFYDAAGGRIGAPLVVRLGLEGVP